MFRIGEKISGAGHIRFLRGNFSQNGIYCETCPETDPDAGVICVTVKYLRLAGMYTFGAERNRNVYINREKRGKRCRARMI